MLKNSPYNILHFTKINSNQISKYVKSLYYNDC